MRRRGRDIAQGLVVEYLPAADPRGSHHGLCEHALELAHDQLQPRRLARVLACQISLRGALVQRGLRALVRLALALQLSLEIRSGVDGRVLEAPRVEALVQSVVLEALERDLPHLPRPHHHKHPRGPPSRELELPDPVDGNVHEVGHALLALLLELAAGLAHLLLRPLRPLLGLLVGLPHCAQRPIQVLDLLLEWLDCTPHGALWREGVHPALDGGMEGAVAKARARSSLEGLVVPVLRRPGGPAAREVHLDDPAHGDALKVLDELLALLGLGERAIGLLEVILLPDLGDQVVAHRHQMLRASHIRREHTLRRPQLTDEQRVLRLEVIARGPDLARHVPLVAGDFLLERADGRLALDRALLRHR
mmetsp:Transcript_30869/g.80556  ORF Transcript_30869/g.80556 Transcript_30869/m.80556 type:complete len:364 (+) Transcript_30869:823-1914(+)